MIKPQLYTALFEEKIVFNEKYTNYHFELKQPYKMDFKAGQYVSIMIPGENKRRLYSICSNPNIHHGFELLIDLEGEGIGRNYLKSLNFGDKINFFGPLGLFTLDKINEGEEIILIGTGSGIAPMRSLILDLLQNKKSTQIIKLFWGMRFENDLFWLDELSELEKNYPNFSFQVTISKPSENWNLSRGHVTDFLITNQFNANSRFFICGNPDMAKNCKEILLKKEIPLEKIQFERFTI
jgi:NAD(P)H-flavin reductase